MFFEALQKLLVPLGAEARAFWSLLLVGESHEASGFLYRLFSEIGLVHLLVLSGSQVEHFRRTLILPFGVFSKLLRVSRASRIWVWIEWGVYVALVFYVWDVGEEAPLVRALIFRLGWDFGAKLVPKTWCPLAFLCVHVSLYPQHVLGLSFYLSWFSYWALAFLGARGLRGYALVFVVSVLSQTIVCLMKDLPMPSMGEWMIYASANVIMIPLFEYFLFPLGATLLWGAFFSIVFLNATFAQEWLRWFFDSLSILYQFPVDLVLGVIKGIRYI